MGSAIARVLSSVLRVPLSPRAPTAAMSSTTRSPRLSDVNDSPRKTEESVAVHTGSPDFEAEVEAAAPRLKGPMLTAAIAFVAGTGFTLFGCVCGSFHCNLASQSERDSSATIKASCPRCSRRSRWVISFPQET